MCLQSCKYYSSRKRAGVGVGSMSIFPGELTNQPKVPAAGRRQSPDPVQVGACTASLPATQSLQNTCYSEARFLPTDPSAPRVLSISCASVLHLTIQKQLVWQRTPSIWHEACFLLAVDVFVLPLPQQKSTCSLLLQRSRNQLISD